MRRLNLQQGTTLIVCLIFMLLLTIIGVGAMRSATLQERMAGNARDSNVAFQAAEAALRDAETYVLNNSTTAPFGANTNGLFDCTVTCLSSPSWSSRLTSSSWRLISTPVADQHAVLPRQPEYFIEKLQGPASTGGSLTTRRRGSGSITWFRITARGFGGSADINNASMVVLQTYYRAN